MPVDPRPKFTIVSECESNGCWLYEVQLHGESGSTTDHRLRLSWEDYDLWVRDGSLEPARVAEAIVEHALATKGSLPERLDSSTPRRVDPDADNAIKLMLKNH